MWHEVEKQYQECRVVIARIVGLADRVGIEPTNGWMMREIGWWPDTIKRVGEGKTGNPETRFESLCSFLEALMTLETDLEMMLAVPLDDDEVPVQERQLLPRRGRDAGVER